VAPPCAANNVEQCIKTPCQITVENSVESCLRYELSESPLLMLFTAHEVKELVLLSFVSIFCTW